MSTCPSCSSHDIVAFTLAPRGVPLGFNHCRACEHRWWEAEESPGTALELPDVIQRFNKAA